MFQASLPPIVAEWFPLAAEAVLSCATGVCSAARKWQKKGASSSWCWGVHRKRNILYRLIKKKCFSNALGYTLVVLEVL